VIASAAHHNLIARPLHESKAQHVHKSCTHNRPAVKPSDHCGTQHSTNRPNLYSLCVPCRSRKHLTHTFIVPYIHIKQTGCQRSLSWA
jgi:hypothetical protein